MLLSEREVRSYMEASVLRRLQHRLEESGGLRGCDGISG